MSNHLLFLHNVFSHLVALMSGIVSFVIGIWQNLKNNPNPIKARTFWAIAALFLFVAADLAWQDEHRNAQVVVSEKSTEVSAKERETRSFNSCVTDGRVQQAYMEGVEGLNNAQRKTIDNQQLVNSRQQVAVDECVVSLGKMNPVINAKFAVSAIDLPVHDADSAGKKQNIFMIVVSTSHQASPIGRIKCQKAFSFVAPNGIAGSTNMGLTSFGTFNAVSPTEYDIDLSKNSGQWDITNPMYSLAVSSETDISPCTFKPQ